MAIVEISAHLDGRLDLGKALAKRAAAKAKAETPETATAAEGEATAPDTSNEATETTEAGNRA